MVEDAAFDDEVVTLDFSIFGGEPAYIHGLISQLGENYEVASHGQNADGYSIVSFTTRTYGIRITSAEHIEWVCNPPGK